MFQAKKVARRTVAFILLIFAMTLLLACNVEEKEYTIRFDANGGVGEMQDFTVKKGQKGRLPYCGFIKEGVVSYWYGLSPDDERQFQNLSSLLLRAGIEDGDVVTLYPIWTSAGFAFSESGIGWIYQNTITKYSGNTETVIVPSLYRHIVNEISSFVFWGHTEIKRLIIPSTIRRFGEGVFRGFTAEQTIVFKGRREGCFKDEPQIFEECAAVIVYELK